MGVRGIAGVLALGVLAACGTETTPTPIVTQLTDETLITATASAGHTFVHDPTKNRIVCSQPAPDAGFDFAEEVEISVSLVSTGSDQEGEAAGSEEVEFAGRTPAVLLSRELFFRACEFAVNFKLDKEEAKEIYGKTLDAIVANWAIEAGNTTVTVGDTVSNTTTTAVSETQSQTLSDTVTESVTDEITSSTSDSDS